MATPLLLTWWLVGRINRFFAAPAALLVMVSLVAWKFGMPADFAEKLRASLVPQLIWIKPVFAPQALVSIGISLFVVTMASQNMPGLAVLRANGYTLFAGSGLAFLGIGGAFWGLIIGGVMYSVSSHGDKDQ